MLIVVPTYKRTQCLPWVLKSIFRCDISGIEERKKILVLNNHPPSRATVDRIIKEVGSQSPIDCSVLHRERTLPALDNWFSGIAEHASQDETIVLLGDDDLMMPWGLRDRYREITRHRGDMLLSDFADRIYFTDGASRYWMTGPWPVEADQAKSAERWEFLPADHPEASFMSNHCYRNTGSFRKGLDLAFAWCDSQDWLPRGGRTAMLPFYLPYTIELTGGKVLSLRSKCVLRGASAEEAIRSTYADGGNTVFYNLCAHDVFANRTLPLHTERLLAVCVPFKRQVIRGFLPMVADKGVSLGTLSRTFRHSGIHLKELLSTDLLKGGGSVLVKLLGLRGIRLRMMSRAHTLPRTQTLFQ